MTFQCKNPDCKRTFQFLGRYTEEKVPAIRDFANEVKRILLEAPCCPFCGSKEFEEIREKP